MPGWEEEMSARLNRRRFLRGTTAQAAGAAAAGCRWDMARLRGGWQQPAERAVCQRDRGYLARCHCAQGVRAAAARSAEPSGLADRPGTQVSTAGSSRGECGPAGRVSSLCLRAAPSASIQSKHTIVAWTPYCPSHIEPRTSGRCWPGRRVARRGDSMMPSKNVT